MAVNNTTWVGMLMRHPNLSVEKYPLSCLDKAWIIEQALLKLNASVVCFAAEDVDFENKQVKGYIFSDSQWISSIQRVPDVIYDFYFTGGKNKEAKYYNDFESWASQNGIMLVAPKRLRHLSCHKIRTCDVLKSGNFPTPTTERYQHNIKQLESFLLQYPRVFIKPIWGNRGNNIFVIYQKENQYHINFYRNGKTISNDFNLLQECVDFIRSHSEDISFLIQEGIDVLVYEGSVYSLRMIVYHDGIAWRMIDECLVGKKDSDLSNQAQGGKDYDMDKILPNLLGDSASQCAERMKKLSIDIAEHLNVNNYGPINDLAIDYLIDKNENFHIGEINVKPGMAGDDLKYYDLIKMSESDKKIHHMRFDHGRLIGLSLLALYNQHFRSPPWLGQIHSYVSLDNSLAKEIGSLIFKALQNRAYRVLALPERCPYDDEVRMVFITVSDHKGKAKIFWGIGYGLLHAINQALNKAKLELNDFCLQALKFDLVKEIVKYTQKDIYSPTQFDRSIFGLAFDETIKVAIIPEQLTANNIIDNENHLNISQLLDHVNLTKEQRKEIENLKNATQFKLYYFSIQSIYYNSSEWYGLYRGHPIYRKISAGMLLNAIELSARYLQKAILPNGQFLYEYLPKRDIYTKRYNILRHAGTIFALCQYYALNPDDKLLQLIRLALDYLFGFAKKTTLGHVETLVIVEDNIVKLGANALSLLALSEYMLVTGDYSYLLQAQKLALWLKYVQQPGGDFKFHKIKYSSSKRYDFVSDYYPGEVVFSLVKLYQIDSNLDWIICAKNVVDYLIYSRDKDKTVDTINHDHWLLYGLNELFRIEGDSDYIRHTQLIVSAIIKSQHRLDKPIDYFGGFYNPPRSTPTAIRAEGLCAAYALMKGNGMKEAAEILNTIKNCICFQLQTQFTQERTLYLDNPQKALGGFSKSLTDFSIRIDYVQHNISSLIGLYRILKEI